MSKLGDLITEEFREKIEAIIKIGNSKKDADLIIVKDYNISDVDSVVIDIISLRVQRFDWHEINDILELNITDDRVRRKVTEERNRLGFKFTEDFIFWLTKSGIIKPVSSKSDKK